MRHLDAALERVEAELVWFAFLFRPKSISVFQADYLSMLLQTVSSKVTDDFFNQETGGNGEKL